MSTTAKNDNRVTPFIMRTGFLVSYTRTLLFIYSLFAIFLIACQLSGVLVSALSDIATYVSWLLWPVIVALNKNMIGGFQNLFDIFSDDDMKHSKRPSRPFRKPDTSIQKKGQSKPSTLATKQGRIKGIFTEAGHDKFINKMEEDLFNHPKKKYMKGLSFVFGLLIVYGIFVFIIPFDPLLYGAPVPEGFWLYQNLTMIVAFLIVYPLTSMAWLLFFMMVNIHRIRGAELKIAKTVPILRKPTGKCSDDFMGYNEFRERIVLVGQFLFGITIRIAGIFVVLMMAEEVRTWFLNYEWSVERFVIGGALVLSTSTLVYITQVGLHSILNKWKNEFIIANHERKFEIDFEIQRELDLEIQRIEEERENQNKSPSPSTEITSSHSSARFEAANRLDNIMREIESTSTWAINSANAAQVFSVSLIPLITSILPLIVERLFF